VIGTAATPVITGRSNLTGGDLIFLGNRYVIQGGAIDFVNPTRTEPVVNLRATTSIQQYNINLTFEGPADRMRTSYTSTPSLPPVDIIHLIAFGSTETAAQASTTTTTQSAESLVANTVSSQLASSVAKVAGISQLSFNPNLGGVGRSPGPTITVQQHVTSKLFVTFTTDLTSAQYEYDQVQVQYEVSPRWSVSTTRDQNGGFGFDARYHKTF
jgi:translocation and assembly module TamB